MKTGKYLYGIIESKKRERFGNIGVGNGEVYTIQHEDIGAVISDIPFYYKIDIEEAKIHEKTLRKVMETHTIIPMGFGIVAKNDTEIINILKGARMKFKNTLEKISNRLQINVKISWDKTIFTSIFRENEEIRALAAEARERNADQSHKIELGRKIKAGLDEKKNEYLKNIHSVLREASKDFKENKINDQTIMNTSFLIDREQEKKFYDKAEDLEKEYEKKLLVLVIGPLPPYNFTNIKIKKMDFNRIEEARKTLGLEYEVNLSEINAVYENYVRKYHPDLHPHDPFSEEKFKKIKNAFEVLTEYCKQYLCSLKRPKVEETLLIQTIG